MLGRGRNNCTAIADRNACSTRVTRDCQMEDRPFCRLQMYLKLEFQRGDRFGGRITLNAGLTNLLIEPFVREHHMVSLNPVFQSPAFLLPVHTTDLENVGKIGAKCDAEWHPERERPVIDKGKLLVRDIVPEKLGALQVERSSRYDDSVEMGDVQIGEVGAKEKVVCLDGRTER